MMDEADRWKQLVTGNTPPAGRLIPGESVTKGNVDFKTMKLEPTVMQQRETRCRAVFKIRGYAGSAPRWQRCINIAYLDAFVDTEELLDSNGRVALCYVHAGVCMRGNLRIAR